MTPMVAVLFADLAASMDLYARVGDESARELITTLQDQLAERVVSCEGVVQEIIGDELMARFEAADAPDAVLRCAGLLHRCAEQVGRSRSIPLALRIGMHWGPAIVDADRQRLFGDTVNVAARMREVAGAQQSILTEALVMVASPMWQLSVRRFDVAPIKGRPSPMVLYDLPWRQDELTAIIAPQDNAFAHAIELAHGGATTTLATTTGVFTIGRAIDNDLMIDAEPVSRRHCRIEYLRGRFVLTDQSTNGTHVYLDSGEVIYMRRQQWPMTAAGQLALGASRGAAGGHLIDFRHLAASQANG